jgi:hypothetical protein
MDSEKKGPGRPAKSESAKKQMIGGRMYPKDIQALERIFGSIQKFLDDAAERLRPGSSVREVSLDKKSLDLIERKHGSLQQFINAEVRWLSENG